MKWLELGQSSSTIAASPQLMENSLEETVKMRRSLEIIRGRMEIISEPVVYTEDIALRSMPLRMRKFPNERLMV
jgi:hypothetical protein